jgi:hypothetical protein
MPADAPAPTGLDRRRFLAAAGVAGLLGLPAAAGAAAPLPVPGPGLRAVRLGDMYLVNGWVLTAADVRALGLAA